MRFSEGRKRFARFRIGTYGRVKCRGVQTGTQKERKWALVLGGKENSSLWYHKVTSKPRKVVT